MHTAQPGVSLACAHPLPEAEPVISSISVLLGPCARSCLAPPDLWPSKSRMRCCTCGDSCGYSQLACDSVQCTFLLAPACSTLQKHTESSWSTTVQDSHQAARLAATARCDACGQGRLPGLPVPAQPGPPPRPLRTSASHQAHCI